MAQQRLLLAALFLASALAASAAPAARCGPGLIGAGCNTVGLFPVSLLHLTSYGHLILCRRACMFGARCAPQPALFQCVTDVDIAGAFLFTLHSTPTAQPAVCDRCGLRDHDKGQHGLVLQHHSFHARQVLAVIQFIGTIEKLLTVFQLQHATMPPPTLPSPQRPRRRALHAPRMVRPSRKASPVSGWTAQVRAELWVHCACNVTLAIAWPCSACQVHSCWAHSIAVPDLPASLQWRSTNVTSILQ